MNHAHDDDGIIDLRSLASTRPPPGAYIMPSPFASEPPPAFTRDADGDDAPAKRSKARTIGLVVAAAAFLVLGCVGVGYAFRGAKPAAVHAAAVAPPAPSPVAIVAPPAPAPEPATAATASTDDATAAADAAAAKKTKGGKARAAAGGARTTTKSAAAPAKAVVSKASDPCSCHGDFQCNIRCAANK